MTPPTCPEWCESDHAKVPTCLARVGLAQTGPDAVDVVIVRLVATSTIPASVAVLPLRRFSIPAKPLMLAPADALSLSVLLEAVGVPDLAALVREGADILANREDMV